MFWLNGNGPYEWKILDKWNERKRKGATDPEYWSVMSRIKTNGSMPKSMC